MNRQGWRAPTDFAAVCKRATGRRVFNARRKYRAWQRRQQVRDLLTSALSNLPVENRPVDVLPHGRPPSQKWPARGLVVAIARQLGVSASTIARDVRVLQSEEQPCPLCQGAGKVDQQTAETFAFACREEMKAQGMPRPVGPPLVRWPSPQLLRIERQLLKRGLLKD
jgi:hypothetical protein